MTLMQKAVLVYLSFVISSVCGTYTIPPNPCDAAHHAKFPEFGSRNTKCTNRSSVCDYYLDENWYVAPNSILLNTCPRGGGCGVAYPIWMRGNFPDVTDGIVDRDGCTLRKGDCCRDLISIKVKNCSNYYVYYLRGPQQCPSAYCFDSNLPCEDKPILTPSTTQTFSETSVKKEDNGGIDKGLLIGILCGVAVILIVSGATLAFVMKSKGCHKAGNAVNNVETPTTMPPAYEEIPKSTEKGYINPKF